MEDKTSDSLVEERVAQLQYAPIHAAAASAKVSYVTESSPSVEMPSFVRCSIWFKDGKVWALS